ncbi:PepSY domain-containing protein [Micromonospora sp. NPDC050187]|uniref:PepSY domain-containing protein n=1 Tax=Micromonospora sp. NPDC050187 TaxID=3364277 RepID=UPI0037B124F4
MKRKSLIMASVGGAAVLAVSGAAIGTAAAAEQQTGRTALTAATTAPTAPTTAPTAPTTPDGGTVAPTAPSATSVPSSPSGTTSPSTGDAVDRKRAEEIALAKVGGGRVVEVEAEKERGRKVWSVEIVNGSTEHEVDVDRADGSVVKTEQEPVDDDDDDRDDDDDDRDDDDDDDRDDD